MDPLNVRIIVNIILIQDKQEDDYEKVTENILQKIYFKKCPFQYV